MKTVVKKIGDLFRVVDQGTGDIAKGVGGKPIDGGGHGDEGKAERQCGHINGRNEQKIGVTYIR